MDCYIINLDRSVDRIRFIEYQFSSLMDIPACGEINPIRVSAVDAKQLSENDIWNVYDKNFNSFNAKYIINIPPEGLSVAEIACFLSHRKVWQSIVSKDEAYAAVFEDDVMFSKKIIEFIGRVDWIPPDADLIKLEVLTKKIVVDKKVYANIHGTSVVRFYSTNVGTAAYIVSKNAAIRLLQLSQRFYIPVDHFMFGSFFPFFEQFKCYQIVPAVCIQDKELNKDRVRFESTLTERDRYYQCKRPPNFIIKIRRSFVRFFGRLRESIGKRKRIINSFNDEDCLLQMTTLGGCETNKQKKF